MQEEDESQGESVTIDACDELDDLDVRRSLPGAVSAPLDPRGILTSYLEEAQWVTEIHATADAAAGKATENERGTRASTMNGPVRNGCRPRKRNRRGEEVLSVF